MEDGSRGDQCSSTVETNIEVVDGNNTFRVFVFSTAELSLSYGIF